MPSNILETVVEENVHIMSVPEDDRLLDGRLPPQNMEAEQALLGAILHNNNNYERVAEILQPDYFSYTAHQKIFECLGRLIERGQLADPVTLNKYFLNDPDLVDVGGASYLADLVGASFTVINVKDYAEMIYDMYLRRQLIDIGEETINDSHEYSLEATAESVIERTEQKLFNLATQGQSENAVKRFSTALGTAIEMAENAFKRDSHVVGVTTGLTDMDKMLGGLHPSDLVILAGRPSMGKTALCTNLAFNAALAKLEGKAQEGGGVLFFSLEMSADQLANRLLAQEARISSHKIRQGDIRVEDFQKFTEVAMRLSKLDLFIDDTPGVTVSAMRTRARRLKRMHDIGMIVIDYLQLIQSPGGKNRAENRVQELSEITRSLKALAKELNVPVLALSQLSRAVEQREDKRPQLADLRESGSIEQDADVVMFIYREEYYLSRKQPEENSGEAYTKWAQRMSEAANKAEVIIAKQRHGPIGSVELFFEPQFTKFGDLSVDQHLRLAS